MRERMKKIITSGKIGPLIGLIFIVIVVSVLKPEFLSSTNLLNVLRQVSINAIIAFGMTFVILTGGIDLSVGSVLALTSAVLAGLIAAGIPSSVAILICLALGAFLGMCNGVVITKGKAAPFIATLATMTILRGLTLVYTNGKPISNLGDDKLFSAMGKGYFLGIPIPVLLMSLIFIILTFLLTKTTFGRKTYAIGGNEDVSKISGINVSSGKTLIYMISGLCASIAGIILTSRLGSAQPTAGASFELDAIAAVVLGGTSLAGGKGWLPGTLFGALIIGVLNNGLNMLGISSFWQQVVKGTVILLAVLADRRKS